MLRSSFARYALGVVLGALAGASLCLSVLPLGLQWAGYGTRLALGFYLSRMILFAILAMAAGGYAVVRARHPLPAMAVFSLAGLGTGLLLAGMGLGREPRLLAVAGATGWLYGLVGGMILGRVLLAGPAEEPETAAETAPPGQDGAGVPDAGAADPGDLDRR